MAKKPYLSLCRTVVSVSYEYFTFIIHKLFTQGGGGGGGGEGVWDGGRKKKRKE